VAWQGDPISPSGCSAPAKPCADSFARHLTLRAADGWQSLARFAYIQVGTPGIDNITPDRGALGVEIRPIPQDLPSIDPYYRALEAYAAALKS
jgi:hypothetical protein